MAEPAGSPVRPRAAVVVLGDVGRSPRMQYHALSLAEQAGMEVDVVGYGGSTPHRALIDNPHIHLHLLGPAFGSKLPRLLYLLFLPIKLTLQIITLVATLCFSIPRPNLFIVQNPPSIPVLTVVQFACWLRGARLIIDWHNFGYTLLGLRLGPSHPLVLIHRWYERRYGKRGDAHLCVTKAMQQELGVNWGIQATVLYDRPPEFFRRSTVEETHELFQRLKPALITPTWSKVAPPDTATSSGATTGDSTGGASAGTGAGSGAGQGLRRHKDWLEAAGEEGGNTLGVLSVESEECTVVTVAQNVGGVSMVRNREDRPAVVVSSTSWSADEDFGMMLEAAVMYDRRVAAILGEDDEQMQGSTQEGSTGGLEGINGEIRRPRLAALNRFPRLLFIVTGKGPLREHWEQKMASLRLQRVALRTLWLEPGDYPRILGSADLGVSLHTSSSGLDLPMKVVDMFGCSLPVCALAYSCIGELVQEGTNGLLFSSSSDLASQLVDLFKGFPSEPQPQPQPQVQGAPGTPTGGGQGLPLLGVLRKGAETAAASSRWADEWGTHVLPLVRQLAEVRQ